MFGSKNRSKRDARRELIDSMPVDPNGDVTEDYLRERHAARSPRSRLADERSTARKVFPLRMPPEQAASWVAHPGRYDVEGIDTKGKANVKRRERRPATPKAKTPAKPKGPIPVKDSGVIVSGKEIVDITNFFDIADCPGFVFGNGECSMGYYFAHGISLSRNDGRGMFGLDNESVIGMFVYETYELAALDRSATYKISIEGNKMVFRTGDDFSEIATVVTVGINSVRPRMMEDYTDGRTPGKMFEFDAAALTQALEKMDAAGVGKCKLASTKWGISLSSDDGYFDFIIGPRMNGISGSSVYWVERFLTLMRALAPYVHSMGFGPDGPLFMKGEFGDYALTAALAETNLNTPTRSGNRKKGLKQLTGRRNKR